MLNKERGQTSPHLHGSRRKEFFELGAEICFPKDFVRVFL